MFSPDVDFERSKSSAHVRALASDENAPIERSDAATLAESPWPHHQIDAGWVYMHLYAKFLQEQRRKTDLLGSARRAWQVAAANPHAKGKDRLHAEFARSHSGLWVRAAEGSTGWDARMNRRYTAAVLGLGALLITEPASITTPEESRDVAGALAEIIVAMALNDHNQIDDRSTVTIPAQSWNDDGHKASSSNFDLWQVTGDQWRKVQVKGTRRADRMSGEYDNDIAVVILEDHLKEKFGTGVNRFSVHDMTDQEISDLGGSMQTSIDAHFAKM